MNTEVVAAAAAQVAKFTDALARAYADEHPDDPLVVGWRYAHQRLDEVSHVDRIDRDGIVRGHLRLAEQITGHPITKAVR